MWLRGRRWWSYAEADRRSPPYRGLLASAVAPGVKTLLTILAALVLAPLTVVVGMAVPGNGYYLSGTLIVLYAIVPFFVSFEGRRPTAREIAVVAVLTALAVAAARRSSGAAFSSPWPPSL